MRRPQTGQGFTLLEILVVLGVLGILLGIGLPGYVKIMQRQQVAQAAQQLAQDIEAARADARRLDTCAAVRLPTGSATTYSIDSYPDKTCSGTPSTRTVTLPSSTRLSVISTSALARFIPPYGVNATGLPVDLDVTSTGNVATLKHLRITGVLGAVVIQ